MFRTHLTAINEDFTYSIKEEYRKCFISKYCTFEDPTEETFVTFKNIIATCEHSIKFKESNKERGTVN